MLLSLLLTGLLASQPADAASMRAEAERLAREGAHAEALQRFQAIARTDPRDLEARLWIGRLHLSMDQPLRAEPVFRGVLGEVPDNLEGLLGLGAALIRQDRLEEAVLLLSRAEDLEPDDVDVLAALGEVHRLSGRTTLASAYLHRAAVLARGHADIRLGYEAIRRVHDHWIEMGGFGESFDTPAPDARAARVAAGFRIADGFHVLALGQGQHKLDRTEARGGAGFEWRPHRRWLIRTTGQYGASADVLPSLDTHAEAGWTGGRAELAMGIRYLRFQAGTEVWVASPAVTWWLGDGLAVGARYDRSRTAFGTGVPVGHDSVTAHGRLRLHPRVWAHARYARGNESFDTLSPDRLGAFRADTFAGGATFDLRTLTTVSATYEHQLRADGVRMVRVATSLRQRF